MADPQSTTIIRIPVEVRQEKAGIRVIGQGRTVEMDIDGMYVQVDQELQIDTEAYVTIKPPAGKTLIVQAMVLWCEQVQDRHYDCGLRVTGAAEQYAHFVQQMESVMEQRRSTIRMTKPIRVTFKSKEAFYHEYIANISSGGLFIKTSKPLDEMTEINLELVIPGIGEAIGVKARVVFVMRPEQSFEGGPPPGFGVEFIQFRTGDDLRFFFFLDKLRQAHGNKK